MQRLPFPTIVAASRDDPYVAFRRALEMAKAWGAELVDIGDAGHINTSAGYGEWPEGEQLLLRLQTGKPTYHSA
jgi:predicted alpha/beta hydrolase family esterase